MPTFIFSLSLAQGSACAGPLILPSLGGSSQPDRSPRLFISEFNPGRVPFRPRSVSLRSFGMSCSPGEIFPSILGPLASVLSVSFTRREFPVLYVQGASVSYSSNYHMYFVSISIYNHLKNSRRQQALKNRRRVGYLRRPPRQYSCTHRLWCKKLSDSDLPNAGRSQAASSNIVQRCQAAVFLQPPANTEHEAGETTAERERE